MMREKSPQYFFAQLGNSDEEKDATLGEYLTIGLVSKMVEPEDSIE